MMIGSHSAKHTFATFKKKTTHIQRQLGRHSYMVTRTINLEKKPLIGDKNGGGGSSAALEHGAMGNSPAMSTTLNDDSSQQSSIGYSIDGNEETGQLISRRTLNTAAGVFAPVALSQFSSLLFLRIGYLIGNGGLLVSLALLLGCYFILILTVLSICAISTNGAIEGGGAYFMISRTLGPEMGGAIGLVFYIANVFSCALYTSGCVEGILQGITSATSGPVNATIVPHGNETIPLEFNGYQIYGIAIGINLTLLCICIIGANFFGKCTNFFFLAVSCIAILTLIALLAQNPITIPYAHSLHSSELNLSKVAGNFTGPSIATLKSNLYEHYTIDYNNGKQINAMTLFSVLFSGVTGITNGANMSGELRNPGYSIPRGTLLALSFTFCMYCLLFVATACSTATDVLQYNYVFMGYVSFWMPLVYVGIALATLCASLSNMIGASRILRAVADDRVFGNLFNFLSWGCTRNNNNSSSSGGCSRCLTHNEFLGPLLLTFVLSAGLLAIGDMNSIAPYTCVFFLLSYAMINLSCMMLSWAAAPNFRPQFKHFSLISCGLGLLSTVVVMLLLSVLAAFICIVVFGILLFCLYLYHLKHPSAEIQWGSVAQAVLFHTVRKYLLKLDFRREHVKFWRPHLLLLVANPRTACPLIDFLNDLKKSGIYILGHVMVSEKSPCDLSEEYNRWQELVDHLKVKAFVSVTESSSLRAGALQMVRVTGLGALKPNTVVLGFRDAAHPNDFLTMAGSRYMLRPSKSIPSNWHPIRDRKGADDDASPARDRLPERLSLHDYVGLLNDILRAGKNLALCRHFDALNKEHIIRRRNQPVRYIDVWPINFMCPETSTLDDTASLFTLQLGTILNMVKFWSKNTKYRVFLIEPFEWPRDFLTEQQAKIKETLASVRMNAEIVSVPWKAPPKTNNQLEGVTVQSASQTSQGIHDASNFSSALTSSSSSSSGGRGGDVTGEQLTRLTAPYLDDVNSALRTHGTAAAVTLLNVSPPPLDVSKYQAYIDALTIITDGIGPCVMVHGVSKVTTTML
ncbi:solute carrier family 12 member 9 isoform X2 [Hyalella azteca]|uniref:Solute carrier family 12 member 9 n=1 Tax=Hyalella azteca TaxID=294128 RepID=A0A8B7NSU0_HYAAZ|nr:solute carrier family 12 member 9 isoform X2 [Hyalella azteca]